MRKRLTARGLTAEKRSDGLYPGDVGNPDAEKFYHDPDEYTTYEWQEGWDTPSNEKPWEKDAYDKVGFGIPKKVQAFRTAKKASVLASLMLGDDASDRMLQAQARDLMKLGYSSICSAIRRMQAANEAAEQEEKKEEAPAPAVAEPKVEAPAPAVAEQKEEAPAPAAPAPVAPEAPAAEAAPAPAADVSELTENAPADEEEPPLNIEIPETAPAATPEGVFNPEQQMNVEQADPELEKLFSDDQKEEAPAEAAAPTACKTQVSKQGIKHIAAQPKLASTQVSEVEALSHIWDHLAHPNL